MLKVFALISAFFIVPQAIAQVKTPSGTGPGSRRGDFFSAGTPGQCQILTNWSSQIVPGRTITRDNQLYEAAHAAFGDDRFIQVFGRAYLDLSESELNEVHAALLRCFRDWRSNLSGAFLPARMTQAVLWRQQVGTGPKAEVAKRAQAESRNPLNQLLLQTDDIFVYGRECGVVNINNGARLIETPTAQTSIDLVLRKDPTYRMVPANPDFRRWFESDAIPVIARYCPTTRDIYVNSFAAGVHVEATSFVESPSPMIKERPINTFAFNRAGGTPQYRMVGPIDESLEAVRALRGKIVAAEVARNADYKARLGAARDEALAASAERAKIRASTLAVLEGNKVNASPAMRWLTPILLAHGSTRGEILKYLGTVKLSDSSAPQVTAVLSREEQRAAIRAAVEQLGLKIDPNASATLVIRLESAAATAKFDAGFQHLEVPLAGVWSTVWIEAPATILREHAFVRTSATIANSVGSHLVAKVGFGAATVRSVIAKSIAGLRDDAAVNTKAFLSNDDWLDLLIPHLKEADQLYASFQQSAALSHNGAEALLAGMDHCCKLTTGDGKPGVGTLGSLGGIISALPSTITGVPNGDGLWDPVALWGAALAARGIRGADNLFGPGYVPFLYEDVSREGMALASYGSTTWYGSVVTSVSYLREPNCLVGSGGSVVRSFCETVFSSSGGVGLEPAEVMMKLSRDAAARAAAAIGRDHGKLALNTAVLFPALPPSPKPPAPVQPVITGPPGSLISSENLSVLFLIQRETPDPALVRRYRNELQTAPAPPEGAERLYVWECKYVPRNGSAGQPEIHYFWNGGRADVSKLSADNPARIHLLHIPVAGNPPPSLDEMDRLPRPRY